MAIIDKFDRKILQSMQCNAINAMQCNEGMSQRQIAASVGLSQNACWRRITRLEDDGILRGSRARIDGNKLGLDLTIFVMIKTRYHSKEWSEKFRKHVADIEAVGAFYRIGGDWDYLLKIPEEGIGWEMQVVAIMQGTDKLPDAKRLMDWSLDDGMKFFGERQSIIADSSKVTKDPELPDVYDEVQEKLICS